MKPEMEQLQFALESYHMDSLKFIAETLGIEPAKPPRKQKLVSDLCYAIPDFAGNSEFIKALSHAEREVLKQMVKFNRICDHRDIALPLIKQGLVNVKGLVSTKAQPSIDVVLQSLLSKGLIVNATQLFHSSDKRQFEPLFDFGIPPEVRAKLVKVLPVSEDVQLSARFGVASEPVSVQTGNMEEFLRRLFFTWSELRRKPARLLKSGDIGKRDQRRLADSLGLSLEQDLHQMQLLYSVLKALNLVQINDGLAEAADNHAVTLFWNTSPVGQMRELLNAYAQLDLPVDFNVRPLSEFSYYGGLERQTEAEIRKVMLEVLGHLPSGLWIPYALFNAFATSDDAGYLVLSPDSLHMLISNMRWYGISRKAELQKQLIRIENAIVHFLIREMCMLGFVDIGYGQQQNALPEMMRISELLHAHFAQQPWPKPEEQGQVILQPDSQLLAIGPVPLHILANLERVAVREKQDQSVITYRITREGIYQAFQHDETIADIKGYLEDATGQPLPQNIARSIEEWADQNRRIVVRRDIQILQVAASGVLDSLMADSVMMRYLHRLDGKTAWVKMQDSPLLEKRLRALEILPSHSRDHSEDLVNSVRWDGEYLVSRTPLPSLYVIGTMQLIAEVLKQNPHGQGWVLTPESIEGAVASGWKPMDIIKTLETMTGGALSLEWEKKIKAWGKYYGDGYSAHVRLIRLGSTKALDELRSKDRNLSRWLKPLPQSEALAVVKETNWEETQSLLASYGILIREETWW